MILIPPILLFILVWAFFKSKDFDRARAEKSAEWAAGHAQLPRPVSLEMQGYLERQAIAEKLSRQNVQSSCTQVPAATNKNS